MRLVEERRVKDAETCYGADSASAVSGTQAGAGAGGGRSCGPAGRSRASPQP